LAWLGLAWLGLAWLGLAWLGLAWLGLTWLGLAWLGLAWNLVILHTHLPMKMEETECSETTYKIQTPGNYPKESIQHSQYGESLISRIQKCIFDLLATRFAHYGHHQANIVLKFKNCLLHTVRKMLSCMGFIYGSI
jgi:hypothetical protein